MNPHETFEQRVMRAGREGQCVELGASQLTRAAIECETPEMQFL